MDLYSYVGNDPINRTDPSGTECVSANTTTCGSDSAFNTFVQSVLATTTVEGIGAGIARENYDLAASKLDSSDKVRRTELKEEMRGKTPPMSRAIVEIKRPGTGPREGSGGTANRTSAGWNKAGALMKVLGKTTAVTSVAMGAARIAAAENKAKETATVTGETGGAAGGGWLGAEGGFMVGGPWGALIGGVAGSIAGGFGGGQAGEATYDYTTGQ